MHPNQDRSTRTRKLTSLRSAPVALEDLDKFEDEDALWEALPDTVPLDPKIVALADELCDEEFQE